MTKKIRHHQLLRYVNHYTSHLWARRIIPSLLLAGQKAREYNRLQKLDTGYLQVREQMTAIDRTNRSNSCSPFSLRFKMPHLMHYLYLGYFLRLYTLHLERFVSHVAFVCSHGITVPSTLAAHFMFSSKLLEFKVARVHRQAARTVWVVLVLSLPVPV